MEGAIERLIKKDLEFKKDLILTCGKDAFGDLFTELMTKLNDDKETKH